MERSESDSSPTEAVDIENVMQSVRRQILERQLPGQMQLPEAAAGMPPEYYEHLFRAGLAQSRLEVEMLVTRSDVPLFGPLIDRLRVKIHELVVFYINRFADNQAKVNNHILQALSVLGRPVDESENSGERSAVPGGYVMATNGEIATIGDVYACFQLLLDRKPDPQGWEYWTSLVKDHPISRAYLVDSFLSGQEFKRLQAERSNPILVEMPDFRMYVRLNDAFIGAKIAREKRYEPHVSHIVSKYLSPGKTFVDVGANIGYFSLLAAERVGPGGRVIALEPNPENCELLRRSAAANSFERLIDLRPVAVAEESGTLRFLTSPIDSNGQIIVSADTDAEGIHTVEAVALDEALADCARVDVIKLDVEGAEALAWRGMQEIIKRHRPVVVFEFSPILLRQTSEVDSAAFLDEVQAVYDLFIISQDGKTSSKPDSTATIIDRHITSNQTHLDILALPRR